MMPQNRREWIVLAASLGAIASAAVLILYPRHAQEDPRTTRDQKLVSVRKPLLGVKPEDPGLYEQIAASMRGDIDLLSVASRAALLDRIVQEIVIRAASDASPAIVAAHDDHAHRWILASDAGDWTTLTRFLEQRFPANATPRGSAESIFEEVVPLSLGAWHDRFVQVGTSGEGMRVVVSRVRTTSQLDEHLLQAFSDAEKSIWFDGQGQPALRFRLPVRALEDILRSDDAALAASLAAIIRTESGAVICWYSHWYWDPKSAAWMCHGMYRKGRNALILF
jgi:hypothetical protein